MRFHAITRNGRTTWIRVDNLREIDEVGYEDLRLVYTDGTMLTVVGLRAAVLVKELEDKVRQ